MGLLLADWSVELFRARRKKAKKAKMMEKMERVAKVEEEEMADVVERVEEVERVEIEAGKNTEKIVTSREVETSTGQINSRLHTPSAFTLLVLINDE